MKVLVDRKLCEANGRCVEVAPEVFEVRDDDKAHVLVEQPNATLKSKLELAVRMCPRQAIAISED